MKQNLKNIFSSKQIIRVLALSICFALLSGVMVGCNNSKKIEAATLAKPAPINPSGNHRSIPDEFYKAIWQFASKTSGSALVAKRDQNTLYSPISLYYALAMLEAGSAGKTKTDLRQFLDLPEGLQTGEHLQSLYKLMWREGDSEEQIANAVWMKKELADDVGQGWLDQLANQFYASAFKVDFSDKETPAIMSKWVEEQTKGKIKPEIELEEADLILMNTLYFKAEWEREFSKNANEKKVFFAPSGAIDQVMFMNRAISGNPYLVGDQFKASAIELKNGKIDFILPNEGVSPESLLANPDFLKLVRESERKNAEVEFSVPKFSYRHKIDLLESLEKLGLRGIVQGAADFSVMLPKLSAEVAKIFQETFIDLNEQGVEAAAYTQIDLKVTGVLPEEEETIVMNLDRPFIYVISDDAGAPLFVGIINNPVDGK